LVVVTVFVAEALNTRFSSGITDAVPALVVVEAFHTRIREFVADTSLAFARTVTRQTHVGLSGIGHVWLCHVRCALIHLVHVRHEGLVGAHVVATTLFLVTTTDADADAKHREQN
jgi:hypothetical protein